MSKRFDPTAATQGLAKAITEAQPGEKIIDIPVAMIEPDPDQPRKTFTQKYIESLGASMVANGQESAIIVRPVTGTPKIHYRIIFGERRWRAAQIAGLTTIKAVVRNLTDQDAAAIYSSQVAENFGQQTMTLAEQVTAALRMVELFGTAEATARMAIPKSDVSKLTTIGRAGGAVAAALDAGHTESIETLYLLARVQKQDPAAADRIVSSWSDPDKRIGARKQVQAALDRINTRNDQTPDHGHSDSLEHRSTAETITDGFGRSPATDADPIPVVEVTRDGDYLRLHTISAGTFTIYAPGLVKRLADLGLVTPIQP